MTPGTVQLCKGKSGEGGRVGRWEDSASSSAVMSYWTKQPYGIALGLSDIADPYDRDSVLLKGKYILINYHIVWKFSANIFLIPWLIIKKPIKRRKTNKQKANHSSSQPDDIGFYISSKQTIEMKIPWVIVTISFIFWDI